MQARKRPTHALPTLKSLDGVKADNGAGKEDEESGSSKAEDMLNKVAKDWEEKAAKWEESAKEQVADIANALQEPAEKLAAMAKETVAGATTALSGLANQLLDALAGKTGAETSEQASEEPVQGSENPEMETEPIDFSNVEIEPLFEESVDFETFSKSDFRAVKVKDCIAVPKSKKLLQFTLDDGTGTDRTILSGIHAFYEPEQLIGKTLVAITNLPPRKMMGIDSCGMLLSAVHEEEGEEKLNLLMVDPHIPAGAKLY